ncbi:MAG TPA: phosphodiesterase [bacterium]|nr:phosphodiesterase [bacterium]
MLIAQLTDPHVTLPGVLAHGFVDTTAALRRAVAHLRGLAPQPDIVLLTGDLVDSVEPAGYRLLREVLAPLPMPVFAIPGNHDDRELLRAAFGEDGYLPAHGEFLHYVVEDFPLRLIGLDTHTPGEVGGSLCETRLTWLAEQLEEAEDHPTLLFMHHPPFHTGLPLDRYGFPGAESLGVLVERHRQVRRIVCGHIHRPVQTLWHGVLASTCPATAFQIALELDAAPRSHIAMEPPALQLHAWHPETGIVSHTSPIGDYPVRDIPRTAH